MQSRSNIIGTPLNVKLRNPASATVLDENLSFKIKKELKNLFNDLKHVSDLNLINTDDYTIWDYAKTHHYSIVTFDADFIDLSVLNGFPPKIIWLRVGNSSTVNVVQLLKNNYVAINEFLLSTENGFLEIN